MKIAKVNTRVYVRAFEGHPLVKCTLKGMHYDNWLECWVYVVKPLETLHGYYRGQLTTCNEILPTVCAKWSDYRCKWSYKPFKICENLPTINETY